MRVARARRDARALLRGGGPAVGFGRRSILGDFAGLVTIPPGRQVYLECRGQGSPTVVLEAGLRNRGDIWNVADVPEGDAGSVYSVVSEGTRVCEYDRPGTTRSAGEFSRSTPIRQPRTTAGIARDLELTLRAARVPAPLVLVGHSTGGLIIRTTPPLPEARGGLVLVDAISEGMQDAMNKRQFAFYNRRYLVDAVPGLEGYADLETVDFYRSFRQIRRKPVPVRPVPEVTITKGKGFGAPQGVAKSFADFVDASWSATSATSRRCSRASSATSRARAGTTCRSSSPPWSSRPSGACSGSRERGTRRFSAGWARRGARAGSASRRRGCPPRSACCARSRR